MSLHRLAQVCQRHLPTCPTLASCEWSGRCDFQGHFGEEQGKFAQGQLDRVCGGISLSAFQQTNGKRQAWRDSRAKVFHAAVAAAAYMSPLWFVMENVEGILAFKQQLRRSGILDKYHMCLLPLCPARDMKEPNRRPRDYLLFVRKDIAIVTGSNELAEFIGLAVSKVSQCLPSLPLRNCLDSSKVHCSKASDRSQLGQKKCCHKWVRQHDLMRARLGMPPSQPHQTNFLLPREKSSFEVLSRETQS